MGVRSPYSTKDEITRHLKSGKYQTLEIQPFATEDVASYLCRSLDQKRVEDNRSLLPLVLERTHGLPLHLHLFVRAIQRGEAAYTEESIRRFDVENDSILREGIRWLAEEARRLEEMLCRDEFIRQERILSRKMLPVAEYQAQCSKIKATYHAAGETHFQNLMAMFAIANESLTEGALASILELAPDALPCYLSLAARFLREDQDGYSFLHDAFREFTLREKSDWVQRLKSRILAWCIDPANRCQGYAVRHGVTHLLAAYRDQATDENAARIAELLTDIDFITTKIRAGLVSELLEDYQLALDVLPGGLGIKMLELEPLDADDAWIIENRAARIAGLQVPHPGRGGEVVLVALLDRREEKIRKKKVQKEQQRQENIADGRDPEHCAWDDFEFSEASMKHDEHSPSEVPGEPEPTKEESMAEERKRLAERIPERLAEEQRHREQVAQIIRPMTATDRTISRMRQTQQVRPSSSLASCVGEFAALVRGHWSLIAEKETDVPALCTNFRSQGAVHEAGLRAHGEGKAWIKNLYTKADEIHRLKLRFKIFDGSPDTGTAIPFDHFKKCVAVSKISPNSKDLWFEILDVAANCVTATMMVTYRGKIDKSLATIEDSYLRATEDGQFARYYNLYFELSIAACCVRQIDPDLDLPTEAKAFLDIMPKKVVTPAKLEYLPYSEDIYRFISDDGAVGYEFELRGFDVYLESCLGLCSLNACMIGANLNFSDNKNSAFQMAAHGRIVALSKGESLRIFDLVADVCLLKINVQFNAFTLSQDGKLFAIQYEGEIRIWDVYEGNVLKRFAVHNQGQPIHFSAAGELLFVGEEIVDLRTGPTIGQELISCESNSNIPNSPRYLKTSQGVWDVLTPWRKMEQNGGLQPKNEISESVEFLLLTEDHLVFCQECEVASAPYDQRGYWIWMDPDISAICRKRHEDDCKKYLNKGKGEFLRPRYSPITGKVLLASENGLMILLNPADGEIVQINQPDYLATLDSTVGQAYIESSEEKERWEWEQHREVLGIGPHPGKLKKIAPFSISGALLSDDGLWILTVTDWDAFRIWSVKSGKCERIVPLPKAENWHGGFAVHIGLSTDGRDCNVGLQDGSIYQLRAWMTSQCEWIKLHSLNVDWSRYSSLENRRFLCPHTGFISNSPLLTMNGKICEIYDLDTGVIYPRKGKHEFIDIGIPMAMTPDNQHALFLASHRDKWGMGKDHFLRVLRLDDFSEVMRFPMRSAVKAVSNIAPDGRFAVLTDSGDLLRLKLHMS